MKINIKRVSEDLNIKYNEARWNCMQGVYEFCTTSKVNGRFRYAFDELKYMKYLKELEIIKNEIEK